ncbi:glycosyltransferase [Stappia sp. F7233]|uniref:Glycosyltransferase n=1 Tax=Stappia albiluteola TaxID=2758565 RepID=A0A839AAH9_9HYPH|nr:glycosyltransferase [Stappia albiluteola]MBA5776421.1 glycosyltransferase [Stappia albiluteola]
MRRFLYISPFFPPNQRVGALAPLKIVRHLPEYGWEAVVLADQAPDIPADPQLAGLIPPRTPVDRGYSGRGPFSPSTTAEARRGQKKKTGLIDRISRWAAERDVLPIGDYGAYRKIALSAARRLLEKHPCDLIVAQSTPVAALLVGRELALETGLPLVSLFADPWRCCELRNRKRLPHTWIANAFHERRVIDASARAILYTERCRDDYRGLYPHRPPETFVSFHNGFDRDLQAHDWVGSLPSPSLLFFGTFGNVIRAEPLIRLLARAARSGGPSSGLRLFVTHSPSERDMALAAALGVAERITIIGHQPYAAAQAILEKADVLVEVNSTAQRIVAKTYDYLASSRPILSVGPEHPELARIFAEAGAALHVGPDELVKAVSFLDDCLAGAIPPRSRVASEKFSFRAQAQVIADAFDAAAAHGRTG